MVAFRHFLAVSFFSIPSIYAQKTHYWSSTLATWTSTFEFVTPIVESISIPGTTDPGSTDIEVFTWPTEGDAPTSTVSSTSSPSTSTISSRSSTLDSKSVTELSKTVQTTSTIPTSTSSSVTTSLGTIPAVTKEPHCAHISTVTSKGSKYVTAIDSTCGQCPSMSITTLTTMNGNPPTTTYEVVSFCPSISSTSLSSSSPSAPASTSSSSSRNLTPTSTPEVTTLSSIASSSGTPVSTSTSKATTSLSTPSLSSTFVPTSTSEATTSVSTSTSISSPPSTSSSKPITYVSISSASSYPVPVSSSKHSTKVSAPSTSSKTVSTSIPEASSYASGSSLYSIQTTKRISSAKSATHTTPNAVTGSSYHTISKKSSVTSYYSPSKSFYSETGRVAASSAVQNTLTISTLISVRCSSCPSPGTTTIALSDTTIDLTSTELLTCTNASTIPSQTASTTSTHSTAVLAVSSDTSSTTAKSVKGPSPSKNDIYSCLKTSTLTAKDSTGSESLVTSIVNAPYCYSTDHYSSYVSAVSTESDTTVTFWNTKSIFATDTTSGDWGVVRNATIPISVSQSSTRISLTTSSTHEISPQQPSSTSKSYPIANAAQKCSIPVLTMLVSFLLTFFS